MRHSLQHYEVLLQGVSLEGTIVNSINYDNRARKISIETHRREAIELAEYLAGKRTIVTITFDVVSYHIHRQKQTDWKG